MPNRIELDIFNSIKNFYEDEEDINVISNKKVDKFRPDIIIKKNNRVLVIIEINEHNHAINLQR